MSLPPQFRKEWGSMSLVSEHRQVDIGNGHQPAVTLVIPTRNESGNVEQLLRHLRGALAIPAEVLFVDDSDDATPWVVKQLVDAEDLSPLTVSLVHRTPGQRSGGLGSAVREGLRRANGRWVCVMDADLQHPPEIIPKLMAKGEQDGSDLIVASRFLEDSSIEGLSPRRQMVSRMLVGTAKAAFPRRLRNITDPLSGFFMLRNGSIDPEGLHPHGFKILLEIVGRNPDLKVSEVGFEFAERFAGASKASVREGTRFLRQLAEVRTSRENLLRLRPGRKISVEDQSRVYSYDIHGIITVQSHAKLPELEKFRVRHLNSVPTVLLEFKNFSRRDKGELIDLTDASARIRYDEKLKGKGFAIEVEVSEQTRIWTSKMITRSPHVLYTNVVEPILRWKFVEMGYALVHAACFTDGDEAHLVTARTDTGKTTTMLKVLELGNYGFLSDDLVLLDADGFVHTYPKPLTISNHTVHALKSAELGPIERLFLPIQSRLHSKSGREFALYLASKSIPVATLNATVQRIIPPPKYHVDRLVPGSSVTKSAMVKTLTIIQRGDEQRHDLPPEDALSILRENCEDAFGFPPYQSLETLLHTCSGDDLRFTEQEIMRRGLAQVEARLFSSSSMGWADDIHTHVVAKETSAVETTTLRSTNSTG